MTALARGGEPLSARVPDVRRMRTGDARRRIEGAGFKVGKVYEVSRERILRGYKVRYPAGYVFMQAPSFTETKPIGTPIMLVVSALRDGPVLPPGDHKLHDPKPRPKAPRPTPPPDDQVPPPAPPRDAPKPPDDLSPHRRSLTVRPTRRGLRPRPIRTWCLR